MTKGISQAIRAASLLSVMIGLASSAIGAPAVGDSYSYRVVNAYNKETLGNVHYRVDRVDADRFTVSVSTDKAAAGGAHTGIYTKEGNWLRSVFESHGVPVEYEFATAYPAYAFPLEPGKSWSVRVKATLPGSGEHRSVRVDGRVIGNERIRVPAGEFDTIKIRRSVYPGDMSIISFETQIVEYEWYAPALGQPVRTERNSEWTDVSHCGEGAFCLFRGSWNIYELVEARAAPARK